MLDDELLAKGIQESLNAQEESSPPRRCQQEKEEETREVEYQLEYDEDAHVSEAVKQSLKEGGERKQREEDEKIAKDLQHFLQMETEERTKLDNESVFDDEDEQLSKTIEKSLEEKGKQKQFEEQANKDEQIAQDLHNQMAYEENSKIHDEFVLVTEDEQLAKTIEKSLEEEAKRKQFEEQAKKDEQIAQDLHNQMAYEESSRLHDESVLVKEDEQLAKTVEKSLMEKGKEKQTKDEVEEDEKLPEGIPPPSSICGSCNSEIEHAKSVDISGVLWHPECLWCDACHKPITIYEVENHVSNARGMYHKSCYGRFCYICKEKMSKYHEHHFWKERYCPSHESDGTHKCCSCERLEPRETNYVMLGDTRWLCLECMESAVMDSHECQPLHFEIREYFEGLNMKIEKEFPFLLVEKQALNKAEKEEKIDYQYEVVTRGICLSEAQTVTSVSKVTRTGSRKQLIEKVTESQRVVCDCEVTAILILYGLPRLLTGYILAHEMMHAYLRLNGM